jgi:hypothetical protein
MHWPDLKFPPVNLYTMPAIAPSHSMQPKKNSVSLPQRLQATKSNSSSRELAAISGDDAVTAAGR